MFCSSMNTYTFCLFLYKFDSIRLTNHVNWYSHLIKCTNFNPCTCEPKGINRFSLRQNLRLLLTLFESKPHIIIIFHSKTNRQKLEKYHVNGSQTRRGQNLVHLQKEVFLRSPYLDNNFSESFHTGTISTL